MFYFSFWKVNIRLLLMSEKDDHYGKKSVQVKVPATKLEDLN